MNLVEILKYIIISNNYDKFNIAQVPMKQSTEKGTLIDFKTFSKVLRMLLKLGTLRI